MSPAIQMGFSGLQRAAPVIRWHVHTRAYAYTTGYVADSHERAAVISARFQGKTCFVQGASRGLGLELVRQLLLVPDNTVIATCRRPDQAADLQQLQQQHGSRLHIQQLDTLDDSSIQRAAAQLTSSLSHLDLLLNVSGILHNSSGLTPETSITRVQRDNLLLSLGTNAIGPILVCQALLPLISRAAQHGATEEQPAVIANFSARVGSISDNRLGGWYSYRASKAALNQLTRTMALELARKKLPVAAVLLHPGTCETGLSQPFQKNVPPSQLFPVERGASQLLHLLAGLGQQDNGRYMAWDQQDIPW